MTGRFPTGACDTHIHVYDTAYPASRSAMLFPSDASVADYRAVQSALGLQRVVVVQPSTYGLDNACQIDAAEQFGDDARLVVVVDDAVTDGELARLTSLGARGARFHVLPGGAVGWDSMAPVAARIEPYGWHVQLQMDGNLLPDRVDALLALPTPIVVDHVGRFMPPPSTESPSFGALLALLDTGRCWVKLSAPYESAPPTIDADARSYPGVTALVHVLVDRFPERLLWATNWPHPGQEHPMSLDEIRALTFDWLPTDELRRQVLVDNPAILYEFDPV